MLFARLVQSKPLPQIHLVLELRLGASDTVTEMPPKLHPCPTSARLGPPALRFTASGCGSIERDN